MSGFISPLAIQATFPTKMTLAANVYNYPPPFYQLYFDPRYKCEIKQPFTALDYTVFAQQLSCVPR
jgi:hypothetical protein